MTEPGAVISVNVSHKVEYLPDAEVTELDDQNLRDLLSSCFNPPADRIFAERRYFQEQPPHRWVIRHAGRIVAHAASHEKRVKTSTGALYVAGVAEVCTERAFRRAGRADTILKALHAWASERQFDGVLLFGEDPLYRKLGYREFTLPVRHLDYRDGAYKIVTQSVRFFSFTEQALPEGLLDIDCPLF